MFYDITVPALSLYHSSTVTLLLRIILWQIKRHFYSGISRSKQVTLCLTRNSSSDVCLFNEAVLD